MKKLVTILIALLLVGCSSKLNYDKEYGIRYSYNDSNSITINLDTKNPDKITSITIAVDDDIRKEGLNSDTYPNDFNNFDEPFVYYNEDFEYIRISPYIDNFDETKAKELSDYLGIEINKDMSLSKFLDSETFIYRKLLEEGTALDDISFTGLDHKVDEKYYKR